MSRFNNYFDFNVEFLFSDVMNLDDRILNYIMMNDDAFLEDRELADLYSEMSEIYSGYNSDKIFNETLIDYYKDKIGKTSKSLDIIEYYRNGYTIDEIKEDFGLSDDEINGKVKDKNYY